MIKSAENVICPKCKSSQVQAMSKGFSGKKAFVGAILVGQIGVLAGTHGSGDINVACLNCGNQWNPRLLHKIKDIKQKAIWKKSFYHHYNKGNLEIAESTYLSSNSYTRKITDIHSAYRAQKSQDKIRLRINIVVTLIVISVFSYLLILM